MHRYSRDFYGQPLRLVALGFIRWAGHAGRLVPCRLRHAQELARLQRWRTSWLFSQCTPPTCLPACLPALCLQARGAVRRPAGAAGPH